MTFFSNLLSKNMLARIVKSGQEKSHQKCALLFLGNILGQFPWPKNSRYELEGKMGAEQVPVPPGNTNLGLIHLLERPGGDQGTV